MGEMMESPEETLEQLKEDMRQEIRDFGTKEVKRRINRHHLKYLKKKEWVDKMRPSPERETEKQNLMYAITEIKLFKAVLGEFTG